MFSCRGDSNTTRLFARAFLTVFVGTFLLVSQPRIPKIFAHPAPDRESRILNLGDFLAAALIWDMLADQWEWLELFSGEVAPENHRTASRR